MKKQSEIIVKYLRKKCEIELGHYRDNTSRIAMMLIVANGKDKGEEMSTVSTHLREESINENEIFVKITDEKEELFQILINEGVLIDTGKRATSGWNQYAVCQLNFEIDMPFIS